MSTEKDITLLEIRAQFQALRQLMIEATEKIIIAAAGYEKAGDEAEQKRRLAKDTLP